MNSIDFNTEEIKYLLSLVLTRYHQIKKNEQNINDDEVIDSLKKELSVLMSIYDKIESISRAPRDM